MSVTVYVTHVKRTTGMPAGKTTGVWIAWLSVKALGGLPATPVTDISVTPPFQLLRNGVAIVDGIESIQLAYAVDADGNGVIDDQAGGLANTVDCLDFVPNNGACTNGTVANAAGTGTVTTLPVSVNATPSSVRQVRITVVGRAIPPAARNVANYTWSDSAFTGGSAVTAEDQVIASTPGIRRRALTRIVSLRDASQS